jgi:hypothetical protein
MWMKILEEKHLILKLLMTIFFIFKLFSMGSGKKIRGFLKLNFDQEFRLKIRGIRINM